MSPFAVSLFLCASAFLICEAGPRCPSMYYNTVCLTNEKYPSNDLDKARDGCQAYSTHLCALCELDDAYRAEYRETNWGLVERRGRDAKITSCSQENIALKECFVLNEDASEGYIPTTLRAEPMKEAYCCKDFDELSSAAASR